MHFRSTHIQIIFIMIQLHDTITSGLHNMQLAIIITSKCYVSTQSHGLTLYMIYIHHSYCVVHHVDVYCTLQQIGILVSISKTTIYPKYFASTNNTIVVLSFAIPEAFFPKVYASATINQSKSVC